MRRKRELLKRLLKRLGISLLAAAVGIGLTLAAVTLYWKCQGGAVLAVQTASMEPVFEPGDALAIKPASPADIRVGDIINFVSPADARVTISHRVVAVDKQARTVTTKGDNVAQPDTPIALQAVRGRAVALLPKFGLFITAFHTPPGLIVLVYLPALLGISYELQRLRGSRGVHYVLPGHQARAPS